MLVKFVNINTIFYFSGFHSSAYAHAKPELDDGVFNLLSPIQVTPQQGKIIFIGYLYSNSCQFSILYFKATFSLPKTVFKLFFD